MTKEEMMQQINETFDNLIITKPQTKQQMINKINQVFDNLMIKVDE